MSEATTQLPVAAVVAALVEKHGAGVQTDAQAGVQRAARMWRESDGSAEAFSAFCCEQYVPEGPDRIRLLARLEKALQSVHGHLCEISRDLHRWADLEGDRMAAADDLLAAFDPAPDAAEQVYAQKLAFLVLLNFAPPPLEVMDREGDAWSLDQWAAARIALAMPPRIPGELESAMRLAHTAAWRWATTSEVRVGAMVDADGASTYEPGAKLLPHWKIRDEIIQAYDQPNSLGRQRALAACMGRFIEGQTPSVLWERDADAPWDPHKNTIGGEPVTDVTGDVRYEHWLKLFRLEQQVDAYCPSHPTALLRSWNLQRELSDQRVEQVLEELLAAPVRKTLYALVRDRLGRSLESHDLYYHNPFAPAPADAVEAAVAKRFKSIEDFGGQLADILREIGFSSSDADFFASKIRVEVGRDAGHCSAPGLPEYCSWVRTSLQLGRFNAAAYGTAMHELGHAMEQNVSIRYIPRPALRGVPGSCGAESTANLIGNQRLAVLGVAPAKNEVDEFDGRTLSGMLAACQMAGASLVELRVWRWLYAHPETDAAALRDAVIQIADELWTRYYEPHLGPDPDHLLAAYQHMIGVPLYMANYVLSTIAEHQMEAHVRGKDIASEFVRVCATGRLTPDLWMRRAVGAPLSAQPMVEEVQRVLAKLGYAN